MPEGLAGYLDGFYHSQMRFCEAAGAVAPQPLRPTRSNCAMSASLSTLGTERARASNATAARFGVRVTQKAMAQSEAELVSLRADQWARE